MAHTRESQDFAFVREHDPCINIFNSLIKWGVQSLVQNNQFYSVFFASSNVNNIQISDQEVYSCTNILFLYKPLVLHNPLIGLKFWNINLRNTKSCYIFGYMAKNLILMGYYRITDSPVSPGFANVESQSKIKKAS